MRTREGEVSLYLPPKLSAVCNHASHISQRDREGGGVGVIRRERKSKGREIRRETQTQAAKRTNKPLKAYLKLTNWVEGGERKWTVLAFRETVDLLLARKERCRWKGGGGSSGDLFPLWFIPRPSPWHCHGDHLSFRLQKQSTWQR